MRSSEFLPPGDNGDWLAELLTGLEEPVLSEIGKLQSIIEANRVDLDSLSVEDKNGIIVAGHYGDKYYPFDMPMKVQDLDSAAREMLKTVALFAHEGMINGKNGFKMRVVDVAPNFSVRHVSMVVSQGYTYALDKHANSYRNSEAMEFHETMTLYFAILKRISARAIELEGETEKPESG